MKDNFDVHAWNFKRYLNEDKSFLDQLSDKLSSDYPDLRFYVQDEPYFDRIDVIGSEQDKLNFGDEFHGKKFGEYEVFAIDDDDRGEVVRIVKSNSIMRNFEEGNKGYSRQMISPENPKGETDGLTQDTLDKILKQLLQDKEISEKLCKKGEAYRKRRMAAGEKSSAYLSGRAVKVCKGQMSGKKKKK